MSPPPPGARCARHPHLEAVSVCPRCGGFTCADCERRTRPEATAMCPGCWALRAERVTPQHRPPETQLATFGLVLGIASLVPVVPVWIGSVVVNLIALFKRAEAFRKVRWKSAVGLGLTLVFVAAWIGVFTQMSD